MFEYFATYDGMRDGDTIWLVIDAGFYLTVRRRPYRLMRIDCPEKNTAAGKVSMKAVDAFMKAGKVVTAQTFRQKVPAGDPELTFDRWLAEVRVDGVNLSDWIVENGYGHYQVYK